MIVAHIMGMPIEESVLQLAPVGATFATVIAIAGRTSLGRLRRRRPGGPLRAPLRRPGAADQAAEEARRRADDLLA